MADKRVIALISDDFTLQRLVQQIDDHGKHMNAEVERMKQETLAMMESFKPKDEELWRALENRLREMGKLPSDYKKTTHTLHYSIQNNVVGLSKDSDNLDTLTQLKGAPPEIIAAIQQAIKDSGGQNITIKTIEID